MKIPDRAPEPRIIEPGPGFRNIQGNPTPIHFRTAQQAAAGRDTVLMDFPHDVLLNSDIFFAAGTNPVPRELAGHWYLEANGVTLHTPEPEAA